MITSKYRLTPYFGTGSIIRRMNGSERLTIGGLAKNGAVNVETIRYYERQGLLPEPPRSSSGYRVFSMESVARIRFIKRAQGLGFSLNEIKELLSLRVDPNSTTADVRRRAGHNCPLLMKK